MSEMESPDAYSGGRPGQSPLPDNLANDRRPMSEDCPWPDPQYETSWDCWDPGTEGEEEEEPEEDEVVD